MAGSLLDGLTWWRAGFAHVIAAAGRDTLEVLASGLVDAGVTRVLLAQPRPDGDGLADALAVRLGSAGVAC
ncbi:MAG: hypothetical protein ACRDPR_06645, partial [Nocardioidaceae bacterium]